MFKPDRFTVFSGSLKNRPAGIRTQDWSIMSRMLLNLAELQAYQNNSNLLSPPLEWRRTTFYQEEVAYIM